jgi:hypothetical protein
MYKTFLNYYPNPLKNLYEIFGKDGKDGAFYIKKK